jgi:hypothetical protein
MKTIVRSVVVTAILALAFWGAPKPLNGAPVAYCPVYRFYYQDGLIVTCYCTYGEDCTVNPAYPVPCNTGQCNTAGHSPSGSVFHD